MVRMKRVKLTVYGVVQGVAFRYHTVQEARNLGVTGWVRNCADGSVEAVVEGEMAAVDGLAFWCRTGPPMARVSDVRVKEQPYVGEFEVFEVLV